ncbi:phytoene/squalene synthase family protein [Gordonia zhaorongruii]|uniref:phytoene/squalene synthase family protein n=1 Tax=Gordonia zhaorongruii TaxID=2597659 RepID=UPI001049AF47|nr:phytoene/squalene synthase family protein [Gordonia zhaorongruii]
MPDAARGFALARSLTARAGRTYYLASTLLPVRRRRAVHALYGFARIVDDVVDRPSGSGGLPAADRLNQLESGLAASLAETALPRGLSSDDQDLLAALAVSVHEHSIPVETFGRFLTSMRMDVPGTPVSRNRYRTLDELSEYTNGSAAAIGLQLVPVLGADPDLTAGAALLGEAFQLTNFIRDVAEDLRRDRIYLPLDELAPFGVDEATLRSDLLRGRTSPPLRAALKHLIAVNRDQYRRTTASIAALPPLSRPAISAATRSYSDILRAVERADLDVMGGRAVVPATTRIGHAAVSLVSPPRF